MRIIPLQHTKDQTLTSPKRPKLFSTYLAPFAELKPLQQRLLKVLNALPEDVQRDFLDDHRFRVELEDYEPGRGWRLFMPTPGGIGEGSRCVVLRPRLAECSEEFACYVIAHECAHAFLRNGPWGDITDVEEAADALAASWGFVRPATGRTGGEQGNRDAAAEFRSRSADGGPQTDVGNK
jgi:hypothetical protein